VDAGVELIGSPVPVDPGSVTIEVSAPGYQPFKVTVGIQPRASQSVVVPALVPLPKPDPEPAAVPPSTAMAAAPAAPVPAPSPASEADKGGGLSSLQVIGLVGAGAGVVTAGIGAFFGMKAINEDKEADKLCTETICQTQADLDHADNAASAANVANVTIAIGSALFVAGGLTFLLAPSDDEGSEARGVRVTPSIGPGFAGIHLGGRL
jgi:hypothetical protein